MEYAFWGQPHVGLCAEFASLSWLAPTPEEVLSGIRAVVADVVCPVYSRKSVFIRVHKILQGRLHQPLKPYRCDSKTVVAIHAVQKVAVRSGRAECLDGPWRRCGRVGREEGQAIIGARVIGL